MPDVDAAEAFYVTQLGLPRLFRQDDLLFLQAGDTRLMISRDSQDGYQPAGIILYFKVADLDATYERLRAAAVPFSDAPHLIARMPDHDLYMVFFHDPAGNTLALMYEAARDEVPRSVPNE